MKGLVQGVWAEMGTCACQLRWATRPAMSLGVADVFDLDVSADSLL